MYFKYESSEYLAMWEGYIIKDIIKIINGEYELGIDEELFNKYNSTTTLIEEAHKLGAFDYFHMNGVEEDNENPFHLLFKTKPIKNPEAVLFEIQLTNNIIKEFIEEE